MAKLQKLEEELATLEAIIEDGDFVPRSSGGNQLSPNQIRAQIRKHLADTGKTQSKFLEEIHVNSNTFGKFMSGKYKCQFSAFGNGTYWAAAKYLARAKIQKQIDELKSKRPNSSSNKRPASDISPPQDTSSINPWTLAKGIAKIGGEGTDGYSDAGLVAPIKKTKTQVEAELAAITSVDVPEDCAVFSNCDEVRQLINKFLITSGISQTAWLNAIGVNSKSLASFRRMKGKGAGQVIACIKRPGGSLSKREFSTRNLRAQNV